MPEVTLVQAINLALARAMEDDPNVVVFGEDVGVNGGVFRATVGLQQRFGPERVFDTPLSELLISRTLRRMAAWRAVGESFTILICIDQYGELMLAASAPYTSDAESLIRSSITAYRTRFRSETLLQSDGGAEDAAVDSDILAEHDNIGSSPSRGRGQIDGLHQCHLSISHSPRVPDAARHKPRQFGIEMIDMVSGGRVSQPNSARPRRRFAAGPRRKAALRPSFSTRSGEREMISAARSALLPARLDLLGRTVARGVVCSRMIAEPVGDRLEKRGPRPFRALRSPLRLPRARPRCRAIHLLTDETRCDRLLRQRFGCRLEPQRHGNSH